MFLTREDVRPALMPYRACPYFPVHLDNVRFADGESRMILQPRVVHHTVLLFSPSLHVQLQVLYWFTYKLPGRGYDSDGWAIRGARRMWQIWFGLLDTHCGGGLAEHICCKPALSCMKWLCVRGSDT